MNGIHDLGGMDGFGPVVVEANEPYFHADWERTVLGLHLAGRTVGLFNGDEHRHGIERMDPIDYLRSSYYERWLASIATLLFEKGVLTTEEVAARVEELKAIPEGVWPGRDEPAFVARFRNRPSGGARAGDQNAPAPRFRPGDAVITRNMHPAGHTRLPRYARAKRGVIDYFQGIQAFADSNAHGLGPQPQAVYSVRFRAEELWGETAEPNQLLYIDLWESYLLPVDEAGVERQSI
jgi:nitrile hydratase subunit beta